MKDFKHTEVPFPPPPNPQFCFTPNILNGNFQKCSIYCAVLSSVMKSCSILSVPPGNELSLCPAYPPCINYLSICPLVALLVNRLTVAVLPYLCSSNPILLNGCKHRNNILAIWKCQREAVKCFFQVER